LEHIDVTVTVGTYSFIIPDPDEQYISALSLKSHENFNVTGHLEDGRHWPYSGEETFISN
jgi:hypothetical protein